ncbi:MAG TPA: O-antigen ligase [Flavisolibacter sp.]|nr:O-antigen ligase [Flavisolibacter sp.]
MNSKTKGKTRITKSKLSEPAGKENVARHSLDVPTIIIFLYLVAELVPQGGATDVMAPQWLYLAILDLLCVAYIMMSSRTGFEFAFNSISRSTLTLLYTCFYILSGISILVAINKVEALVCFARFTTTLLLFFNLTVLLFRRIGIMKRLSAVLTVIIAIQSFLVIANFIKGYGETELNQLILGLRGTAGNKNVLAASLVIKVPFLFFGLYHSSYWKKWLYLASFTLCCFAIALLNARAAYISFISINLLYILFLIWQKKRILISVIYIMVPILAGFAVTSLALSNAAAMQEKETYFGNLGQRLGSIALDAKGSGHRLPLWNNAINYVSHHPFIGAGYGNWKLASIPYETTETRDFEVTYHVHNDFLEAATETGVPGALLFLSLFICAGVYIFKTIRNKADKESTIIASFCFMALWVYAIDAFFNFPGERPVMQVFFALLLALIVNAYLQIRQFHEKAIQKPGSWMKYFFVLSAILLTPTIWLNYSTYMSMKAQFEINADVQLEKPQKTYEEVNNSLPAIPNLNSFCMPVAIIKANYLYKEKNYGEALALVKEGQKANPYLPYDDLVLSKIYGDLNKPDSALYYARAGFEKRPKSAALYQQLNATSFRAKDTATLNQAFKTFTRYRNESWSWNEYLNYLYDLPHDNVMMRQLVDSALLLFPGDNYLLHKKNFLEGKK